MTDTVYIDLGKLPEDHPLRNTLLVDIGAEFKHHHWQEFKPIVPGRPLADNTYNTLTGPWLAGFWKWRAPAPLGTNS